MSIITNVEVSNLKRSVIASRNPMQLKPIPSTDENFDKGLKRARLLTAKKHNTPHNCFLKGITVNFALEYTQYFTKQLQRYKWAEFVSSSSLMHRITRMDFSECVNRHVLSTSIQEMQNLLISYDSNKENYPVYYKQITGKYITFETKYAHWMAIVSTCPMGTKLFVEISTNYMQLSNIYRQRKNHKLKEDWGPMCNMIEALPYAELIISGKGTENTYEKEMSKLIGKTF